MEVGIRLRAYLCATLPDSFFYWGAGLRVQLESRLRLGRLICRFAWRGSSGGLNCWSVGLRTVGLGFVEGGENEG